jgi:hypothetical protein
MTPQLECPCVEVATSESSVYEGVYKHDGEYDGRQSFKDGNNGYRLCFVDEGVFRPMWTIRSEGAADYLSIVDTDDDTTDEYKLMPPQEGL